MAFPFLTVFMIFILALTARYAVLNKRREEKFEKFWEREAAADHTPAKDLSDLPYLSVPLDRFPIGKWDADEILMIEDRLKELSQKKMLNLTQESNTDLKLKYGTDNLEVLSEIGENYNELTVLLCDYAKALMETGDYDGAKTVLEYGVSVDTDVSTNYTLLGDCYVNLNTVEKINTLKEQVRNRHLLLGKKILTYLDTCTDPKADK